MKYIYSPPAYRPSEMKPGVFGGQRCSENMTTWSQGSTILTAAYFFWTSGNKMQRTEAGLLRTLLYQILFQAPNLIKCTKSPRWEALCLFCDASATDTWADDEIKLMFKGLLENLPADVRICFFIDGLDEFHGDVISIIRLVQFMAQHPSIKVCVASRPWSAFEDSFRRAPCLMLENFTRDDISRYTESELKNEVAFLQFQQSQPQAAANLVNSIVSKASGVFLWVKLVVASLIEGIANGDRPSDLHVRMDALPDELEDLYDSMVDRLSPAYAAHAAKMFQLMNAAAVPPRVLEFTFTDEETVETALARGAGPLKDQDAIAKYHSMRRRLKSRTMGLLEVIPNGHPSNPMRLIRESSVQYLHRTVKDYIGQQMAEKRFRNVMDPYFDPHLQFCVARLLLIKSSWCSDPWTHDGCWPAQRPTEPGAPFPPRHTGSDRVLLGHHLPPGQS